MADLPILIIGGGTIGLSIGWRLAQAGREVVILERGTAGRGTSWLAAGMLAPGAEIGFEELELYRLNRESLRRWPSFVEELETETGLDVDYRTDGTLLVADDRDAAEALKRRYDFMRAQGVDVRWLSGHEALELEPFVAPRLAAAIHSPEDYQVDNRLLVDAMKQAFTSSGGTLREHVNVDRVDPGPVVVTDGGERIGAETVVVAAGAWSRRIGGLEPAPPVRPVKGQMVELKMEGPFALKHVVRGPDAYVVPKSSGRLLIGATSEEMGFDQRVTAGGLYRILEGAWEVVPGIHDLAVTDTWAGLRPASRDHLPLLGEADDGVVMATGTYRHGILMTPVVAEEIGRLILGESGETSEWIRPFSPTRFRTA